MIRGRSPLIALGLSFAGCASTPPPTAPAVEPSCTAPKDAVVTLAASERANASSGESGLPVRVRLYQLKREARLRNASFEEIWQNDAAALGDDLLDVVEQTAYPSRAHDVDVELSPGAASLAAVALFKNPSGKDWFVVFDVPPAPAKPPCPPANLRISVWVDRMKIEDGQGRELR